MPKQVFTALNLLENKGYEAYLVGGATRNYLLGLPISDYDIATSADPNAIKMVFSDYVTYDIGKKHGTITVLIDKVKIDITPFRSETNYLDHRHPSKVEFSLDLKQDLLRRDFTINALCMDSNRNITDYFDGLSDLSSKTIKAIGNPHTRFSEDALRILRALRFKAKLNFTIEEKTNQELFKSKRLLKYISNERKKEELLQILNCESAFKIINEYLPIFNTFMPFKKVNRKINDFNNPLYALAYLLSKCDDVDLKELKYSKQEIQLLECLISASRTNINSDYKFITCLSNIYQKETLQFLQILHHKDLSSRYKQLRKYAITINDLKVDGNTLLSYGFKGKEISNIKSELLEQIHHKKLQNTKQNINNFIKQYYN